MEDDTEFEDNDGDDLGKWRRFVGMGIGLGMGVVVNLRLGLEFSITALGRLGFGCSCGRSAFWTMRHISVAMSASIIVRTEFSESCGTQSECDELGKEEEEDSGHGDGGWPGLRRKREAEAGWCKRLSRASER